MKRRLFYLLPFVFCAALLLSGCGKGSSGKKEEPIPVRVMKVRVDDVSKVLEYAGNIKGQDEAVVYPKVTGKIIEKVKEEGASIAKGDAIVYVDRDEVGLKFEKAPVESPLTGTVQRIYVDIGSSVTMTTPIALVADMKKAEIDLDIPEGYLPKVSLGQKAIIEVDAYPGEKFFGSVEMISPLVDLQTRTAPIEIVIDNPDHLLQSGMFAKADLIIEEHKNNPVILKEAVIGRVDPVYVYVVEASKSYIRKVRLGARKGAFVEVLEGLKAGEEVVVMGQQRLKDGALVAAEE